MQPTQPRPRTIDWESIERDYRAGLKSIREIARAHHCTHSAIQRHAKAHQWERDLSNRILDATTAMVARDAAANAATEQEIVLSNAKMQADILRVHRRDISHLRNAVERLVSRLQESNAEPLTTLADCAVKLSTSMKWLVTLERQAFHLDARDARDTPAYSELSAASSDLLRRIKAQLDSEIESEENAI